MKRLLVSCLLGGMLLIGARPLRAHGGGEIKVAKEPIGPYKLTVWLNPPQPQAGKTMHITVGVLAEDDSPVLAAAVTLEMVDSSGDAIITRPATTAQSTNKLFYETDFPAPDAGNYEITVQLNRGEVTGQVTFPTQVQPTNNTNWLLIGLVGIGIILAAFLFLSGRSEGRQTPGNKSKQ